MTQKNEEKPSKRDIRQLWWDYLKRSDKFKEFCEKRHQLGVDHFGDLYSPFIEYLKYFGNIFEQEFDDWWNGPRRNRWRLLEYPVLDLRDERPENIQRFLSDCSYVIVAVPVIGQEDMASISDQIKIIRDRYKETAAVKEAHKQLRRFFVPSTRIRYLELKTYLRVYDLRKKKIKWTEVIKQIEPHKDEKTAATQREYHRFLSKAERIIENVEKGYFPGEY